MSYPNKTSLAKTVVVVEDDSLLRSLIVEAIESLELQAAEFETADDALIYVIKNSHEVYLILADLSVPGQLDGAGLADLLHQRFPLLPVILTTGYVDADKYLGSWINFLPKPWTLDALIQLVEKLTSTNGSA